MSLLDHFTLKELLAMSFSELLQKQRILSAAHDAWSPFVVPTAGSPAPSAAGAVRVSSTGRFTMPWSPPPGIIPSGVFNTSTQTAPLTPVQLDDEVRLVEVAPRPRRIVMGQVEVGVVRVCKELWIHDEVTMIFDTHRIYTDEALEALSELLADSESTGETFTWSDIISIASGAVPLEE